MRGGIVAALLISLLGGWVWYSYPSAEDLALPKLHVLDDRTIVDYAYNPDGTVGYAYLAEKIPDVLVEDEVVELRNETSYTKFIEVVTPGDDPVVKLETRVYSQPAYAQDADGSWKYLEYATTTEQAFRNRDMTLRKYLTEFLVRSAYADTYSPFSGAGDGYVENNIGSGAFLFQRMFAFLIPTAYAASPCNWATVHDATSGSLAGSTAATGYTRSASSGDNSLCYIMRSFLPFDTSSISESATISAATLNVYVISKTNLVNDGTDYLTVVQTSQATHTTLAVEDYDQAGSISSPTEGIDSGERKDITSVSTGAYLAFTLNTTGLGWIKKSGASSSCTATAGVTCLGIREGHDTQNSNLTNENTVIFYMSERAGTSEDPYLSITYTAVAPEKMRSRLNGGQIRVNGGRFKLQSN